MEEGQTRSTNRCEGLSFERSYVFEICLISKYLFTKLLHSKDQNISDLTDVIYITSRKFEDTYNRIVLPEILGN